MNSISLRNVGLLLLAALVLRSGLSKGWCADNPAQNELPTQWDLPDTAQAGRLHLRVSADYRFICFFRKRLGHERPGLFASIGYYVMLDTKTNATQKVEDLLKDENISGLGSSSGELQFCPRGGYVLVHASPGRDAVAAGEISSLFLVNLKTKHVSKLASGLLNMGLWAREWVVISSMDWRVGSIGRMDKVNPIKILDTPRGKVRELGLHGLVVASDPQGRFIIVQSDPDQPKKPISLKEAAQRYHLLAVDLQGKVIKDFGPTKGALIEKTIVSPRGNYVICRVHDHGKKHLRVVSMAGSDDRIIQEKNPASAFEKGNPVHISDEGIAITSGWEVSETPAVKGRAPQRLVFTVRKWDVKGHSSRLLAEKSIVDVVAAGNRLYYAMAPQQGKVIVSYVPLETVLGTRKQKSTENPSG